MFKNENEIFCQFWKDKITFRGVYFGFKFNIGKSSTRSVCSIVSVTFGSFDHMSDFNFKKTFHHVFYFKF